MTRTPLCEQLVSAGGRTGEYCGAETAASFGDPRAEYEALVKGCGLYDLGWRAKIALTGSDRVRWANGMVTNNVRDLAVGQGNYNFLLNAQGHIQADLYVYKLGERLIVDTELWQAEKLKQIFDKFIVMDDVEVQDISNKLTALAVQGPKAMAVLHSSGVDVAEELKPLTLREVDWNGIRLTLTRMASRVARTYELWGAPDDIRMLWKTLVDRRAKPVGTDAVEMFRVAAGVPRVGVDIRERDLPQETEQSQALHFAKGCYVGQEIVERIRSRGALHRRLAGLLVQDTVPARGSKIHADGKEVGEVTSALKVPATGGDKTLALGYLRRDAAEPGTLVQVDGSQAKVVLPPFREAVA